ncbi:MAG TPA: hypothetical protein VH639_12585 [Bryobacteraceae bacterium]|jgi:hypothetical protein
MMEFLSRIEHLRFSEWVLSSPSIWAYATILTTHTIGMMIVAGVAGVIDLRLLGVSPKMAIRPLDRLFPLAWFGFWINAITGTILLMADATTKLTNPDFYVKMVFVFAGVALLVVMRKKIFKNPKLDETPLPGNAKALAWLSLICWTGAITAGRLLAYLGPVSGVPGLKNR